VIFSPRWLPQHLRSHTIRGGGFFRFLFITNAVTPDQLNAIDVSDGQPGKFYGGRIALSAEGSVPCEEGGGTGVMENASSAATGIHVADGACDEADTVKAKCATALARAVEIEWLRNVLRHSFITYRIAKVKSADQVALEAGNSASIIFKHYRELATEDLADQWFGILPKDDQWENAYAFDRKKREVTLG
jgi:hypothetical protein